MFDKPTHKKIIIFFVYIIISHDNHLPYAKFLATVLFFYNL